MKFKKKYIYIGDQYI